MAIHSHGGSRARNLIGNLPGYESPVWYDADGMAYIFLLSNVQRLYTVTYESTKGDIFTVHMGSRKNNFRKYTKVLHVFDTR